MGFFDTVKIDVVGRKAVKAHADGNEKCKLGKLAEAEKDYAEAVRLYKQAFEGGCRRSNILISYAVLLMRKGDFETARDLMKVISKEAPMSEEQHFELRVNYSVCLWHLGLLDEAIKTLEYAGKYSKNSTYYTTMGSFMIDKARETGDFEAAKALLDEAMDYDDEDAMTLDSYGDYYRSLSERAAKAGDAEAAKENRATALEYYEKAHKLRPGQITTLYHLAVYAKEDGDHAKALELTDKAIARNNSRICAITPEMLKELRASIK